MIRLVHAFLVGCTRDGRGSSQFGSRVRVHEILVVRSGSEGLHTRFTNKRLGSRAQHQQQQVTTEPASPAFGVPAYSECVFLPNHRSGKRFMILPEATVRHLWLLSFFSPYPLLLMLLILLVLMLLTLLTYTIYPQRGCIPARVDTSLDTEGESEGAAKSSLISDHTGVTRLLGPLR